MKILSLICNNKKFSKDKDIVGEKFICSECGITQFFTISICSGKISS